MEAAGTEVNSESLVNDILQKKDVPVDDIPDDDIEEVSEAELLDVISA